MTFLILGVGRRGEVGGAELAYTKNGNITERGHCYRRARGMWGRWPPWDTEVVEAVVKRFADRRGAEVPGRGHTGGGGGTGGVRGWWRRRC